jgi:geranylgeranyl reductase family protein
MTHYDFAVIGAGPAGSSAARRLAKQGASVVLFERKTMPRVKPCGGGVSLRALALLDFPLPPSVIDSDIFGARTHYGPWTGEARFAERLAVLVTRSRFDHCLLEKAEEAGARIVWAEVRALASEGDRLAIDSSAGAFTADAAVIAEGARGRLTRLVRRPDRPDEQAFCLVADVPLDGAGGRTTAGLPGLLDIHFGRIGYGYGWVFHHGTYLNVGVGGLSERFGTPMEAFRRFAGDVGVPPAGAAVRGHFIPRGGVRRVLAADRVLLAGDAGGWADPFQGEGIAYAIHSGQLAAETLLEASQRGDLSMRGLGGYAARCYEAFGRDLGSALTLARWAYWWPSLFLRRMATEDEALAKFVLIEAGQGSYGEYLRWLVPRIPHFCLRSLRRGRGTQGRATLVGQGQPEPRA